jgi:metallo-beta-lactamase class B
MKYAFTTLTALAALSAALGAQGDPSWRQPFEPFRIAGNLYFVGTRGLSSFLLTTPAGHILLDTGLDDTVPGIAANIEKLGFKPADVRIMLSSHAHFDHVGGHASMQRLTGAQVMAVGEDARALETGTDTSALGAQGWKPVKVSRVLKDGETVTLGGTTMTANLTPGHTKGCTTWTATITHEGRPLRVVFIGGTSINDGVTLIGNTRHPAIADDYARTFRVLREFQPDIFVAQHPSMFRMEEKVQRLKAGEREPFVDPAGYRAHVDAAEKAYRTQLQREQAK